jgi:hypothetical protein
MHRPTNEYSPPFGEQQDVCICLSSPRAHFQLSRPFSSRRIVHETVDRLPSLRSAACPPPNLQPQRTTGNSSTAASAFTRSREAKTRLNRLRFHSGLLSVDMSCVIIISVCYFLAICGPKSRTRVLEPDQSCGVCASANVGLMTLSRDVRSAALSPVLGDTHIVTVYLLG